MVSEILGGRSHEFAGAPGPAEDGAGLVADVAGVVAGAESVADREPEEGTGRPVDANGVEGGHRRSGNASISGSPVEPSGFKKGRTRPQSPILLWNSDSMPAVSRTFSNSWVPWPA